ncbi:YrdB family protein [Flavilitoribacter nigricans]|nr:YrdB family protein [Flavilitoribacter nigricans]
MLRFLLEITALVGVGMWGWRQADDWLRFVFAFGLPLLLTAIWGIFAVPDDPSRSGAAPVVTPGPVRLLLELGIFALAVWCLYDIGWIKFSLSLGIVVALHYGVSYDRIRWLFTR